MSVEVIETVGTLQERAATRTKAGSELRVTIAEAGTGAAVDIRKWITVPPLELARPGKPARSDYTGHTREGVWLQPSEAREVAELLQIAATVAERLQDEEYGKDEVA